MEQCFCLSLPGLIILSSCNAQYFLLTLISHSGKKRKNTPLLLLSVAFFCRFKATHSLLITLCLFLFASLHYLEYGLILTTPPHRHHSLPRLKVLLLDYTLHLPPARLYHGGISCRRLQARPLVFTLAARDLCRDCSFFFFHPPPAPLCFGNWNLWVWNQMHFISEPFDELSNACLWNSFLKSAADKIFISAPEPKTELSVSVDAAQTFCFHLPAKELKSARHTDRNVSGTFSQRQSVFGRILHCKYDE